MFYQGFSLCTACDTTAKILLVAQLSRNVRNGEMLKVKALIGKSEAHGLGLIAHEYIPKGTIIWKFVPGFDVIIPENDFSNLSENAQSQIIHYGFYDEANDRHILSADDDSFTNHSTSANSQFCGDYVVVVTDILPGEKIIDDYGEFKKTYTREARPSSVVG